MASIENVEKLRERANVTYEEAKAALDATGDDLLDAMIYLENLGKVAPPSGGGSFHSGQAAPSDAPRPEFVPEPEPPRESFSDIMNRFFRFCGRMLQKGNSNLFEVWRRGQRSFSMPVTVLVVLLLFFFWVVLPLIVVGLFFGFRYRFSGRDLENTIVNRAMDGAAQAAETFKEEIRTSKEEKRQEQKPEQTAQGTQEPWEETQSEKDPWENKD